MLTWGSCLLVPNRIWMSAMTRTRATLDNAPTPLMGEYFAQRAAAGLIVTDYDAASKYPSRRSSIVVPLIVTEYPPVASTLETEISYLPLGSSSVAE